MNRPRAGRRWLVLLPAILAALVVCSSAWAHAEVSPPVVLAKTSQLFTLAVPTEEAGATTVQIDLTVPQGFSIDSFVAAPGWTRHVVQTGAGENAVVQQVTWTGGHTPTDEDSFFQFLASTSGSGSYSFKVRQTYSNGTVVNWSGPESSDSPAPTIEAKSSLSGGGSSTLALIALVVGGVGVVLGAVALFAGKGGRELA